MGKKKLDPEALAEAFKNFQTTHECKFTKFITTKFTNIPKLEFRVILDCILLILNKHELILYL